MATGSGALVSRYSHPASPHARRVASNAARSRGPRLSDGRQSTTRSHRLVTECRGRLALSCDPGHDGRLPSRIGVGQVGDLPIRVERGQGGAEPAGFWCRGDPPGVPGGASAGHPCRAPGDAGPAGGLAPGARGAGVRGCGAPPKPTSLLSESRYITLRTPFPYLFCEAGSIPRCRCSRPAHRGRRRTTCERDPRARAAPRCTGTGVRQAPTPPPSRSGRRGPGLLDAISLDLTPFSNPTTKDLLVAAHPLLSPTERLLLGVLGST